MEARNINEPSLTPAERRYLQRRLKRGPQLERAELGRWMMKIYREMIERRKNARG